MQVWDGTEVKKEGRTWSDGVLVPDTGNDSAIILMLISTVH